MRAEQEITDLRAENQALRAQVATLTQGLEQAQTRIAELEARKTPPPSFVKANVPARPATPRKSRAPEHNHGRRREVSTQRVEHRLTHCPDCGSALGGVQVGRTRQVIELPPPPAVESIEHQVQRGWCSACGTWHVARGRGGAAWAGAGPEPAGSGHRGAGGAAAHELAPAAAGDPAVSA
jgi:hypothetical protein